MGIFDDLLRSVGQDPNAAPNLYSTPQDGGNWLQKAIAAAQKAQEERAAQQAAQDAQDAALNQQYAAQQAAPPTGQELPANPSTPSSDSTAPPASAPTPPPDMTAVADENGTSRPFWVSAALAAGNAPPLPATPPGYNGNDPAGYGRNSSIAPAGTGYATQLPPEPPAAPPEGGLLGGIKRFVAPLGDAAETAKKILTYQRDPSLDDNAPAQESIFNEVMRTGGDALEQGQYTGGKKVDISGLPDPVQSLVRTATNPTVLGSLGMGGPEVGALDVVKSIAMQTGINIAIGKGMEQIQDTPYWRDLSPEEQQNIIMAASIVAGAGYNKFVGPKIEPAIKEALSSERGSFDTTGSSDGTGGTPPYAPEAPSVNDARNMTYEVNPGDPLYHGTSADFAGQPAETRAGLLGRGQYSSLDPAEADAYATRDSQSGARVYEQTPKVLTSYLEDDLPVTPDELARIRATLSEQEKVALDQKLASVSDLRGQNLAHILWEMAPEGHQESAPALKPVGFYPEVPGDAGRESWVADRLVEAGFGGRRGGGLIPSQISTIDSSVLEPMSDYRARVANPSEPVIDATGATGGGAPPVPPEAPPIDFTGSPDGTGPGEPPGAGPPPSAPSDFTSGNNGATGLRGNLLRWKVAALGGRLKSPDEPNIDSQGPLFNITRNEPGLTLAQKAENAARGQFGDEKNGPKYSEDIQPHLDAHDIRIKDADSFATAMAQRMAYLRSLFQKAPNGDLILQNGDAVHPSDLIQGYGQAPEEVAQLLTPEQSQAIETFMAKGKNYLDEATKAGLDTTEWAQTGGYAPRGTPTREDAVERIGKTKIKGQETAAEKDRAFDWVSEGRADGQIYPTPEEAAFRAYSALGKRISSKYLAEDLKPYGTQDTAFGKSETSIPLEGLSGYAFRNEYANPVIRYLNPEPSGLKTVENVGNAINSLRTTGDLAAPARMSAANVMAPVAAGRSLLGTFRSVTGSPTLGNIIAGIDAGEATGGPSLEELIRDGHIELRDPTTSNWVTRAPVIGDAAAAASRVNGTFPQELRLLMAQKMWETYDKAGLLNTPGEKASLGEGINQATGVGKDAFGGKGKAFINFPKWLGSQMQFVKAVTTDFTTKGALAREALFKLGALGTIAAYGVNGAQGNDTEWKNGIPIMKFPGGVEVNPFGGWGTLLKDAGALSPISGHGLMHGDVTFKQPDVAQVAIGKGSPPVQIGAQIATGQSFNGVNPSVKNPEFWARTFAPYTASDVASPVSLDGDHELKSPLITSPTKWGLGAFGVRATDPTDMAAALVDVDKMRSDAVKSLFPDIADRNGDGKIDYTDLNDKQNDLLRNTLAANPEWKKANDAVNAAKDPSRAQTPIDKYTTATGQVNQTFADAMKEADDNYNQTHDAMTFKAQYIALQDDRRKALDQAKKDLGNVPSGARGSEKVSVTDYLARNQKPEDKAVDNYYNLMDLPQVKYADGKLDFSRLEALQTEFLSNLPPEVADYVNQRVDDFRHPQSGPAESAGTNAKADSPGVQDYLNAKQITTPYFQAQDDVFNKWAGRDPFLNQFSSRNDLNEWIKSQAPSYNSTPAETLAAAQKASPGLAGYMKEAKAVGNRDRIQDPELDKELSQWYGYQPVAGINKAAAAQGKGQFIRDVRNQWYGADQ